MTWLKRTASLFLILSAALSNAHADWMQRGKLGASDGAPGDQFGYSVAMSDTVAVIGACLDDDNGETSGSAYVFELIGGVWTQVAKLIPDDGAAGDRFGWSVAIAGEAIVVGAPNADDNGVNSGSAYVFENVGGVWVQAAKLVPDDGEASDVFGISVAVSGDTLVIGATEDNDLGASSGSVYIYEKAGTAWGLSAKLLAQDGSAGDRFGWSIAISDNCMLVGARHDDDNGSDSGSAYILTRVGGDWIQTAKLIADDGSGGDEFGYAVSLAGDAAIVGARHDDDGGGNAGAVYVFEQGRGVWTQTVKLRADDASSGDEFGCSVASVDETVVAGAWHDDGNGEDSGSAYVFRAVDGAWVQVGKIAASDGAMGDEFGYSVAISGETVLVGAIRHDDHGADSGSAYVFAPLRPVEWPVAEGGNGHFYEVVTNPTLTWTQAMSWAEAQGGYLATITSLDEQVFVENLLEVSPTQTGGYWIGLRETDIEGEYEWVTDEPLDFTYWLAGEPNNNEGAEDRAQIIWTESPDEPTYDRRGHWNDVPDVNQWVGPLDTAQMGYVIEMIPCPGDLSGDGVVDQTDLGILLAFYGWSTGGDLDSDGDTDQSDLGILLANYGTICE
ncbi:MAG: hypothetical protein KAS72_05700 [Phycisphaerales bacterium]|nr:hypothetical protein [Phycisphaerales bacterium]